MGLIFPLLTVCASLMWKLWRNQQSILSLFANSGMMMGFGENTNLTCSSPMSFVILFIIQQDQSLSGNSHLSGICPRYLIQVTTSGSANGSAAARFTQVPKTCSHRSDNKITKSITEPWPSVLWCQVHLGAPISLNMLFVMDKLWLAHVASNRAPLR